MKDELQKGVEGVLVLKLEENCKKRRSTTSAPKVDGRRIVIDEAETKALRDSGCPDKKEIENEYRRAAGLPERYIHYRIPGEAWRKKKIEVQGK